jgi:uncharacterized protein YbgA (DUF1722 family)
MFNAALVDFRAAHNRRLMAHSPQADVALGRLALHMSSEEYDDLVAKNPDTLGHSDVKLRKAYWSKFIGDPASIPYKTRDDV